MLPLHAPADREACKSFSSWLHLDLDLKALEEVASAFEAGIVHCQLLFFSFDIKESKRSGEILAFLDLAFGRGWGGGSSSFLCNVSLLFCVCILFLPPSPQPGQVCSIISFLYLKPPLFSSPVYTKREKQIGRENESYISENRIYICVRHLEAERQKH